jgi:hypothetical protein
VPAYGPPDETAGGDPGAGAAGGKELGGLTQFEFEAQLLAEQKLPGATVGSGVPVAVGSGVGVPGGTGVPGVALGEVTPEIVNVIVFVLGGGTP